MCCWIYYKQSKSILTHQSCCLDQQLHLLISVKSSCISNVIQYFCWIKLKSLSNLNNSFRSECTFCVNEHCHSSSTTFFYWHLAGHTKSMTKLSLACSKLTKELCYRACFNSFTQKFIQIGTSCGYVDDLFTDFKVISSWSEGKLDKFLASFNDLINFVLRQSFYVQ